jgi:hypothetical protein
MSMTSTPEVIGLAPLLRVHGPDADLDQAAGEAFLHDPGEGARVGEAVALELVVEIGMGIEVENGERWIAPAHRTENGIRHGMVSAQGEGPPATGEQLGYAGLDLLARISVRREREIAGVSQGAQCQKILSLLGPRIPVGRMNRGPDEWRRLGRTAEVGGARVVGQADETRRRRCLHAPPDTPSGGRG